MKSWIVRWIQYPKKRRKAWVSVFFIFLFVLFSWFDFFPLFRSHTSMKQQLQQIRQIYADQQGVTGNQSLFREEFEKIDKEFKEALYKLPDRGEIPQLLSDISALGRESGLDVRTFEPQEEIRKEFYAVVPVSMRVVGSFHDLARFFEKVGKMSRVVRIHDISIGDVQRVGERYLVSTSFVADAYRFIEESEQK